jgi:hypothetical protein
MSEQRKRVKCVQAERKSKFYLVLPKRLGLCGWFRAKKRKGLLGYVF